MIVFIVGAAFHFNIVCSVITTAVFKKQTQEVGSVVDQTSVHQRLLCSVASAQARYKGFDINKETGTCSGILNSDNTEPENAEIYSRSTKANNAFEFLPQMLLYHHSSSDKSLFLSEIPGGMVVGLTIHITLQPVDPWVRIVITLCDESLQRRPMQFVLRNVEKVVRFNYKENGSYGPVSEDSNPPGGFIYENNDVYTLSVVVTDTYFQVQNNYTPFHDFVHKIDKTIATHLYVYPIKGSFANLYKVAFYLPQSR